MKLNPIQISKQLVSLREYMLANYNDPNIRALHGDIDLALKSIENISKSLNEFNPDLAIKYSPVCTSLQRKYLTNPMSVKSGVRTTLGKECPSCGASRGFYCITYNGSTRHKPHQARRVHL